MEPAETNKQILKEF